MGMQEVCKVNKMPKNIESIELWTGSKNYNGIPLVRINFAFPCTWTTLTVEELKTVLRLWIKGEEIKYSREKGFQGRQMLFDEIKKVFDED